MTREHEAAKAEAWLNAGKFTLTDIENVKRVLWKIAGAEPVL